MDPSAVDRRVLVHARPVPVTASPKVLCDNQGLVCKRGKRESSTHLQNSCLLAPPGRNTLHTGLSVLYDSKQLRSESAVMLARMWASFCYAA